jgi:hypothetical protein
MLRLPDEQGLNAAGVKKPAEAERRPSLKADARSFFHDRLVYLGT